MKITSDNIIIIICVFFMITHPILAYLNFSINRNKSKIMDRTVEIKKIFNSILEAVQLNSIHIDLEYYKIDKLKVNQIDTFIKDALGYYNLRGIPKLSLPKNYMKGIYKAYNKLCDDLYDEKKHYSELFILDISFIYNFNCIEYYTNELLNRVLIHNGKEILPEYCEYKISKLKKIYEKNNLDFDKFINSKFYQCWINSKMISELKK